MKYNAYLVTEEGKRWTWIGRYPESSILALIDRHGRNGLHVAILNA